MADPVTELRSAVEAAADSLLNGAERGTAEPTLERPPKPEFGDYSTNAAMLASPLCVPRAQLLRAAAAEVPIAHLAATTWWMPLADARDL